MFAWKLFSKWSHRKFSTMCCSFNEPQFALLTLSLQTWDDAWCPWLKEMVYCNSMHTCHNHWCHKLHQNTSCTCNNTQLDSWSKLFNLTHMWIHREWVAQFSDLLSCAITWKAHGLIYLEYGLWVFLFESTRNILCTVLQHFLNHEISVHWIGDYEPLLSCNRIVRVCARLPRMPRSFPMIKDVASKKSFSPSTHIINRYIISFLNHRVYSFYFGTTTTKTLGWFSSMHWMTNNTNYVAP